MKANVLSPILGLSILGSGLLLLPLTENKTATATDSEVSASVQVAQVTPGQPTLPVTPPASSPDPVPTEEGGIELPIELDNPTDATPADDTDETEDAAPTESSEDAEVDGTVEPTEAEPTEDESPQAEDETEDDSADTTPTEGVEPVIEPPDLVTPEEGATEEGPAGEADAPAPPPVFFPPDQPDTTTPPQTSEPPPPEPQVLVAEVVVEGADGEEPPEALQTAVYQAIATRPGQTATRSQIQSDINAIYATGFFNNVQAQPSDTPLGVRVTYIVTSNPVLRSVQLAGNKVLTEETVDEIFADQYGKVLNLNDLQSGIEKINQYYQDSGYVLGQVLPGTERVDLDGTVTLQVAEGEIESIGVRFQNDEGEPVKGRTKEYIILRQMQTQPGEILNRDKLGEDLRQIFALNLFEDVQPALEPGQDPRKVVVNLNVQERKTGSFSAGAGFSSNSGLFGTGSYSQSNLFGRNYRLNAQAQVGTRDFLFDIGFTNPWIKGDPYRTSYTVNAFNRLTLPLVFDNGDFDETTIDDVQDQFRFVENADGSFSQSDDGDLIGFSADAAGNFNPDGTEPADAEDVLDNPPCQILEDGGSPGQPCDVRVEDFDENDDGVDIFDNLDTPRVNRLGGGIAFTRPLTKSNDPKKRARAWVASAGVRYERVSIRDSDLDLVSTDELGNPLSFSGVEQQRAGNAITRSEDDLFSLQLGIARDLRNDALSPTKGNLLRAGVEQTLPFGAGSIAFTRLRASYSQFLPVSILKKEGPQAFAFNVQGGTIIGDLPPYEAFNLGGSNSVRGFRDGNVGSGRSFVQATAEYRFPLINFLGGIGGVLFVDYGSVLGTDNDIPGNPSIIRGKPGDGFGFGGGVRVKTPIGPVRIDYAINDEGDDRVHFGFGERF